MEQLTGLATDPRFVLHTATLENPNFLLTEMSIQDENSLTDLLESLPSHEQIIDKTRK